jgi:hypothetical protein
MRIGIKDTEGGWVSGAIPPYGRTQYPWPLTIGTKDERKEYPAFANAEFELTRTSTLGTYEIVNLDTDEVLATVTNSGEETDERLAVGTDVVITQASDSGAKPHLGRRGTISHYYLDHGETHRQSDPMAIVVFDGGGSDGFWPDEFERVPGAFRFSVQVQYGGDAELEAQGWHEVYATAQQVGAENCADGLRDNPRVSKVRVKDYGPDSGGMITAETVTQALLNIAILGGSARLTLTIEADRDKDGLDFSVMDTMGRALAGVWVAGTSDQSNLLLDLEQLAREVMDALERLGRNEW